MKLIIKVLFQHYGIVVIPHSPMIRVINELEKTPHGPWAEVRQNDAVSHRELLDDVKVGPKDRLMPSTCKPFRRVNFHVKKMTGTLANKIHQLEHDDGNPV